MWSSKTTCERERHFTKIINGHQHLSYEDRLKSLKLQSLEHRRLIADLIMCYNIIRGHSCIESSSFFTPNRNTTLRGHPYRLSVPLANINVRNHFFSNRIISVWNSLPTELVMSNSTASLNTIFGKLTSPNSSYLQHICQTSSNPLNIIPFILTFYLVNMNV